MLMKLLSCITFPCLEACKGQPFASQSDHYPVSLVLKVSLPLQDVSVVASAAQDILILTFSSVSFSTFVEKLMALMMPSPNFSLITALYA